MTFFHQLQDRVNQVSALCVGIDPHPEVLDAWGVSQDASGAERVGLAMIEALADQVAVFKPQSAFFEQWGAAGIAVLERCLEAIRSAGALAILDVKRGDIGTTMTAYARAYLSDGPLSADAITLSPYLGFDSLIPAIQLAQSNQRGVFILTRTSNREGHQVQLAQTGIGVSVAQSIVDQAVGHNAATDNAVGLVIGATHTDPGVNLDLFTSAILVPGIGAQGGTISATRATFATTDALILPSVSREVLMAGPNPTALRQAVETVLAS